MPVPKITNHTEQALDRLIGQYKELPNIAALITIYVDRLQALETVFFDIIEKRRFLAAKDAQLDDIGLILDQDREGLSDDDYRIILLGRIAEYNSEGTAEELISIYFLLMNPISVQLIDTPPASFTINAFGANPIGSTALISTIFSNAVAEGVGFTATQSTATPFGFEDDPNAFGMDVGELAEVI